VSRDVRDRHPLQVDCRRATNTVTGSFLRIGGREQGTSLRRGARAPFSIAFERCALQPCALVVRTPCSGRGAGRYCTLSSTFFDVVHLVAEARLHLR